MKDTIYHYRDYKKYLNELIESHPGGGRGIKKALAEAMLCQSAFITHVLSGANHFSLEQAEASARYFGLSPNETEFLLLLINFNRAATEGLKKFYDRLIKEKVKDDHQLRDRLPIESFIAQEDLATYYSSWKYGAIHLILTIPEFRTLSTIARRLRLSVSSVSGILEFLCDKGLVEKKQNSFFPLKKSFHLELNSPFTAQHHSSWRVQTVERYDHKKEESIHYSVSLTCSKKDLLELKKKIHQCIVDCSELIEPSKEETIGALCIDFFEL